MNFIKRAFLSVTKRTGKTLLLVLVLAVIANMVLAGISIKSATAKAGEFARKKLGGAVSLEVDMEKALSKMNSGNGGNFKLDRTPLTVDQADKLKSLSHVEAYNYIASGMALTDGFKAVEVNKDSDNNSQGQIGVAGAADMGQPEISVSGTLYSELLADFSEGKSKLIEGRHITKEDSGKNVTMIEKNLAKKNNLKLGDKIKVKSLDGKKNIELEIVGIYEASNSEVNAMGLNVTFLSPYNKIYIPYDKVSQIMLAMYGLTENSINSAIYYLDDPLNVEKFKEEAKNTGIDLEKYKLDAKDSLYKQMMGPIENVASFSNTVVLLVTVAGAVILALIIMLSLKDRKYEIGVLLSIGEGRFKIIGQLLVETLLIATLAFGLSGFSGRVIAQKVGNELLQKEVRVAKEQELELGKGPQVMKIGPGGIMNDAKAEAISEIDVNVTKDNLQKLSIIGLLIVFLSTIIPAVSILRFNPKTILTKNE